MIFGTWDSLPLTSEGSRVVGPKLWVRELEEESRQTDEQGQRENQLTMTNDGPARISKFLQYTVSQMLHIIMVSGIYSDTNQ